MSEKNLGQNSEKNKDEASKSALTKPTSQTVPAMVLPTNTKTTTQTKNFASRSKNRLKKLTKKLTNEISSRFTPSTSHWIELDTVFLDIGFIFLTMAVVLANPNPIIILLGLGIIGFLQRHLLSFAKKRILEQETQLVFKDEQGSLTEEGHSAVQGMINWAILYPLFVNPEDLQSIFKRHRDRPEISKRPRNERILISVLGLVGAQRLLAVFTNNLGLAYISRDGSLKYIERKTLNKAFVLENLRDNLGRILILHTVLFLSLTLIAGAMAYFLWLASYLTAFSLFVELEAERSSEQRSSQPLLIEPAPVKDFEEPTTSQVINTSTHLESSPVQARMMGVKSRIAKLRQSINSGSENLSKQWGEKLSARLAKMRSESKVAGVQAVDNKDLSKDLDRPYSADELPIVDRLKAQSEEIESKEKFYSLLVDEESEPQDSSQLTQPRPQSAAKADSDPQQEA